MEVDTKADGSVHARIRVLGGPDEERDFKIENPELWAPENPKLYEETFRIASGDEVKVRFGFRTVEFREDGFYLNGVRRRLRGVNRHQDAGLCGWAAKREDEERDFALIAEVGADAVRLAHYPQSQHVYDICDEKGILVWSEVPATNWLTDSPGFRSNLVAQAREMVAQLRNHPCVFAWSVFNEIYNDVPPERAEEFVAKGLRATVTASGVTGLSRIELDAAPDFPAIQPSWTPEYAYIPPKPSFIDNFSDSATRVMDQINRMDLLAAWTNIVGTLENANSTLSSLGTLLESNGGSVGLGRGKPLHRAETDGVERAFGKHGADAHQADEREEKRKCFFHGFPHCFRYKWFLLSPWAYSRGAVFLRISSVFSISWPKP